jgi:5-methylcytosine-specific restriction endonuclease McrA
MKKKGARKLSQIQLVQQFYQENPNRDIEHPEVVDWATAIYRKRGEVFRDPDRAIRKLGQMGFLVKIKKGIYRYDPEKVYQRELQEFTPAQKEVIFNRDGYKCVMCGRGRAEGMELHADHIKAKDFGGEAVIENGQTLCSQHNFIKKNFKQTETGKKMFIRLYELAKKEKNDTLLNFCTDILKDFEKHNINGHIVWVK